MDTQQHDQLVGQFEHADVVRRFSRADEAAAASEQRAAHRRHAAAVAALILVAFAVALALATWR